MLGLRLARSETREQPLSRATLHDSIGAAWLGAGGASGAGGAGGYGPTPAEPPEQAAGSCAGLAAVEEVASRASAGVNATLRALRFILAEARLG